MTTSATDGGNYVLDSKQFQLVEPIFDDEDMVSADSVTLTIIGRNGATLLSTAMTYTADLVRTNTWGWFANANLPSDPQTIKWHIEAIKSSARKRWEGSIKVRAWL